MSWNHKQHLSLSLTEAELQPVIAAVRPGGMLAVLQIGSDNVLESIWIYSVKKDMNWERIVRLYIFHASEAVP